MSDSAVQPEAEPPVVEKASVVVVAQVQARIDSLIAICKRMEGDLIILRAVVGGL